MSFQYSQLDKRGNPHIKLVNGDWVVESNYYTSTMKVEQALAWCEYRNSILYKIGV